MIYQSRVRVSAQQAYVVRTQRLAQVPNKESNTRHDGPQDTARRYPLTSSAFHVKQSPTTRKNCGTGIIFHPNHFSELSAV